MAHEEIKTKKKLRRIFSKRGTLECERRRKIKIKVQEDLDDG